MPTFIEPSPRRRCNRCGEPMWVWVDVHRTINGTTRMLAARVREEWCLACIRQGVEE